MDSRFIKSDKIDRQLRNELFKEYYKNLKAEEKNYYSLQNFCESITYYGQKFNYNKDTAITVLITHAYIGTLLCPDVGVFLLPNEINKFSSEFHFSYKIEDGIIQCEKNTNS